jgi:hypothetical protein
MAKRFIKPKRFIRHRVDIPQPATPNTGAGKASPNTVTEKWPGAEKRPGAPREIGGPEGPEPTRYGDWERKGICVDF